MLLQPFTHIKAGETRESEVEQKLIRCQKKLFSLLAYTLAVDDSLGSLQLLLERRLKFWQR